MAKNGWSSANTTPVGVVNSVMFDVISVALDANVDVNSVMFDVISAVILDAIVDVISVILDANVDVISVMLELRSVVTSDARLSIRLDIVSVIWKKYTEKLSHVINFADITVLNNTYRTFNTIEHNILFDDMIKQPV